ncbi:conserved hypothetical protein [Trichinella spiralis]|uniref:hypothetical protein n=1 Tax=Trichinella spiralis TaxID=6334 RepID=UPI0001EFB9C0|nr:conserved hypothetical protein [Trichinella spiralis]
MAEVMRSAFDTLYHFIQTQCRRMTSETVSIGSDSRIKPIESYSHDPLHYIGDMLALIHQATVNEKELLLSLLKLCDKSVLEKYIPLALSKITDDSSRTNFSETIGTGYPLPIVRHVPFPFDHRRRKVVETVRIAFLFGRLRTVGDEIVSKLLEYKIPRVPERSRACARRVGVVATFARCSAYTVRNYLFASVIDPMLQTLTMYSTDLSPVDFATYMLNCINAVHSAVAMYEFSDQRLEMLQAQIEVHLGNVVNEMANYILNKVGLTEAYKKALDNNNSDDQRQSFQLPSPDFNSSLEKFYTFLNSPETLFMPQFFKISSPTIQNKVKGKTIDALIGVYDKIQNSFHVTRHLSEIKALAALATNQKLEHIRAAAAIMIIIIIIIVVVVVVVVVV